MSWQAYVDTNLVGSGKVTRAAIIGQKGGVWAATAGYTLSTEEINAIIAAYKPGSEVLSTGLRLAGQKFFGIRAEGRSIYLKKGGDGAVIVKTEQAILVAEYIAPLQAPETTPIVEGLADYLISVKY
ncbi:profilin [Crucibulum laeve]|uniref:Profilin n=1 Tax=Crucibulum laeve TaxID=68775 RepID=A0A5C3LV27_9AGAR|nr:profilin [Crucibulum laeve]